MWPSKPACHTVSIFTGRTKTRFSRIHSSVLPCWNLKHFRSANTLHLSTPYTNMHLWIISSQSLVQFLCLDSSFRVFAKSVITYKCIAWFSWTHCCKTMRQVWSRSDWYSQSYCVKRQKFCHAYRVTNDKDLKICLLTSQPNLLLFKTNCTYSYQVTRTKPTLCKLWDQDTLIEQSPLG